MSNRKPLITASKIIDILSFLWNIASLTGLSELIYSTLTLRIITSIFIINDIIKGLRGRKQNPSSRNRDCTTSVSCPTKYFDYSYKSDTVSFRSITLCTLPS